MQALTAGDRVASVVDSVSSTPPALISLQIGKRLYPLKVEPQCKTCMHVKRQHIELALIEGYGTAAIIASLGSFPGLDTRNLRRHIMRKHSALELVDTRVRLELHASQVAIDVEASSSIVSTKAVVDEVMHRGFRDLVGGMVEVKASDLLKAAAMMQEIEQRTGQQVDVNFAAEAMQLLIDDVESSLCASQEDFVRWVRHLNTVPHIRVMFERWDAIQAARENPQAAIAVASRDDGDDDEHDAL